MADVEASRRILYSSRQKLPNQEELASLVTIYSYTPGEGEELMGIAARCNIPYGTLASLNRFSHAENPVSGKTLLLPSMPGLFVPETPLSDLERLLFSARDDSALFLTIPGEGRFERFRFFPGDDFSPTERVFFLNRDFHFPLRHFQVSSSFGPRINPITGMHSVHHGVDLAAPMGSEVYAVKSGTVLETGDDPVLGKYVIIGHENNMASFYGHLSSVNTTLRANVSSGSLIAKVGSTGQSTGPHLHFELRQYGQAFDPVRMLRLFKN
jgi:murein DD-endopeptidase MepM/ murein hydrolase activator NlpD